MSAITPLELIIAMTVMAWAGYMLRASHETHRRDSGRRAAAMRPEGAQVEDRQNGPKGSPKRQPQ